MRRGLLCLTALLLGFGLAAQVAAGCGGDAGSEATQAPVTGLIQQVEPRSLLEIESLTVVDGAGQVWVLVGGDTGPAGVSPSHLRDHMLSGLRVTVTYHREDDRLVIDDITD